MTRPGRWSLLVAAVALLGLVAGTSGTLSGWSAASVGNTTDTAAAGMLSVTHAYGATTCAGGPRRTTVACPSTLTPATGAPASSTDAITNTSGRAITQSLTASSCAPVRFANSQQATDPMLPRNTVAFQRTDPWGTTAAASFSGSGYATDLVGTGGTGLLGLLSSSYTIGVWFRAEDAQGGGLISLDASRANATSGAGDPAVWLDTTGHVRFAASGTLGPVTGVSPAAYASGWHLAVITVDTTGVITLTKTVRLYVDGALVATESGLTLLTSATGYWHLGWADFTGLSAPTSAYFHGALSGAFVNATTALSAATVSSLSAAVSAASYRTSLAGQSGIASIWMLDDDGVTTYAGALPGTMANPCGQVNVSLTFTNPAVTVASTSLTSLVAPGNNPRTITAPAAGQTQGLTVSTTRGAGHSTDITGLRLYVPMTFTYGTSPATGWTMAMQWSGDVGDVFLA
ncbi:LamG domain-containing protein [Nocardioides albidus]|uniref:LamG domain-containing protein n=1 Tax=Nocardioides albidus TaxID=1517589 RepID=A0A5C4VUJ5_9ACTN|nr:LamG domain-containing protein [Nocardioides albidus]TNM39488.1 LamG domain-containing protein [Nocardioides albidus]